MTISVLTIIMFILLVLFLGTAPAPTPRVDPVGRKLDEGHRCLITFAADTDVSFWEKSVKPPGVDGGDPVQTTTMHNDDWHTMASRVLKTLTTGQSKVAYDPQFYTQAVAIVNVETTVTILFSNGGTLAFYGYLKSLEFDDMVEGTQPEATAMFVCTNTDPVNGAEEGPVYTAPP